MFDTIHGLGRALNLKPTTESDTPLLDKYINQFSGEHHSDKVLAEMLIKLIQAGTVTASVPMNSTETDAVFDLMAKDKQSEGFALEQRYLKDWQRVLLPIAQG